MYKQNIEKTKTRDNRLFNFERRKDVLNFMKVTLKCIRVWSKRLFEKLRYLETDKG